MLFIYKGCKKVLHPLKEVSPIKKSQEAQPKKVLTMHQFEKIREKIKINNENNGKATRAGRRYIQFQEGDLVMVHLRPEKFHSSTYQKLQAKKMVPFLVLKWLGENAYSLKLPSKLHFSPIFNMEDQFVYHGHQNEASEELDLQLPPNLSPHLEIEYVLNDQLVSTQQGGYKFFLVKWQDKPHSEIHGLQQQIFKSLTLISMNCMKHLTH